LFQSVKPLKYEYRVLHINNYSLFYTVGEKTVTIHRVVDSRRDIDSLLESMDG